MSMNSLLQHTCTEVFGSTGFGNSGFLGRTDIASIPEILN